MSDDDIAGLRRDVCLCRFGSTCHICGPGSSQRPTAMSDDLIERCVHAARTASGSFLRDPEVNRDEYWDYVVRAVLSQVDAAHLPAPITAEDVRAAEDSWSALGAAGRVDSILSHHKDRYGHMADYLNRRGERA